MLPAPLQPRLGATGARRTLDSTNVALGDFELTFAGGRGRPRPDYALTSAGQRRERRRAWALVSQLNWATDRSNVASLGISESIGKVASPYALGTGRTNSQVTTGALSWRHEDAWVLTLNWQRTQGGGGRGIHRLAELAAGAPLSASGVSLTLASQPLPLGMRSTLTFGGLVSSDRLRQQDQEALALNSAERTAGRLFMRVGF